MLESVGEGLLIGGRVLYTRLSSSLYIFDMVDDKKVHVDLGCARLTKKDRVE